MDGWPAVSDDFWRQLLLLGNQCVHRFCVFIVFFQWFFALDFDNLYVWGTLCLKDFCCKTPNISRLVLPMTALLGGFLGVAIILSLRRSALKLVEIAKYQELQKQGDIQDAVSNLNVLQWLGSQTSGFSKEKGLQEGKGWGWNFSKTIFVGLNGRSPLVGGKNYYLPACLTTYPRWEWQLFSLIEVRCSSPKWNKIHIPILLAPWKTLGMLRPPAAGRLAVQVSNVLVATGGFRGSRRTVAPRGCSWSWQIAFLWWSDGSRWRWTAETP